MTFDIPDEAEASTSAWATLYQTDLRTLVAGIGGDNGVLSGCVVSAQGSPDNTVAISSGFVRAAGLFVAVAAGSVTMPAADSTHPMWVLVTVSGSGVKTATAGTAAADPLPPNIPSGHVHLANVWWPASDTTVAADQIHPRRVLLPPIVPGKPPILAFSGTQYPTKPGVQAGNRTDKEYQGGFVYYEPRRVDYRMTINQLSCEIQSAAASGTARMGIYRADDTWQPTALIVDGGTVSITSTGVKTSSVSATLDLGYYLAAIAVQTSIGLRVVRGGNELIGYPGDTSLFGGGMFWQEFKVSKSYGALSDPGTAHNDPRCTYDEGFSHGLDWRIASYG